MLQGGTWTEALAKLAEVLVEYPDPVRGEDGREYSARACGAERGDGMWHGWIEFVPSDGGAPIRSPRETTQPNRVDTHYWATGLTPVYLEGALHRALNPLIRRPAPPPPRPAYDSPAPDVVTAARGTEAILNPFSVYQKGETLLRRQLSALSAWHLVNIVKVYEIPTNGQDPDAMSAPALIDAILERARRQSESAVGR